MNEGMIGRRAKSVSKTKNSEVAVRQFSQLAFLMPEIDGRIIYLENEIAKQSKEVGQKQGISRSAFALTREQEKMFKRLVKESRASELPAHVLRVWRLLIPTLIEFSHHIVNPSITLGANLRMVRQFFTDSKRENDFSPSPTLFNENIIDSIAVMMGVTPHNDSELLLEGLAKGERGSFSQTQNSDARLESLCCMELLLTHIWYKRNKEHASQDKLFIYIFTALSHLYWDCTKTDLIESLEVNGINNEALLLATRNSYYEVFESNGTPLFFRYITENLSIMRHVRLLTQNRYKAFLFRDSRWSRSVDSELRRVLEKYDQNGKVEI